MQTSLIAGSRLRRVVCTIRPELAPKLIGAVAVQYRLVSSPPPVPVDLRSADRESRNPASP
jgi:hypothetical protein